MADAEAARALAADNLTRKDLADFEIFKQLNTLFAAGFLKSNSEASRLLGRTRQDIIRYQAYGQLPPEVIELLDAQPDLIGAAAAKNMLDFLPSRTDCVIEACRRLASGRLKNQSAALSWIEQQYREKPIRNEQRVLDKAGATVGKIVWGESGLKLVGKTLDLAKVEAAIKKSLQDQGYRL
jgi:ParB family chromosome partitioning protein